MNINNSNTMGWDFLKSTIQLSGLAILIYFVHVILFSNSDTLVVATMGTETLSALKGLLFIPQLALFGLFVLCYRFDHIKNFFYFVSAIFLIFFAILAISNLMVSEIFNKSHLLITLNYFMSNMWLVMYSILFWVAANQRFTTKQAAVSYPTILISTSLVMIPVDMLMRYPLDMTILYTLISIATLSIIALCTFVFNDSERSPNNQSISLCQKISYISLLALIFVCADIVNQGIALNLKGSAKSLFSDFESYTDFMSAFSSFQTGVAMLVTCMTCWMAWAFGWRISVWITPVVCLLLLGVYWHAEMHPMTYISLTTLVEGFPQDSAPLLIICLISAVLKGLSVLFLTTKQIAFIPLTSSTKARAYAFIAIILGGQAISNLAFTLGLTFFSPNDIQWFTYPVAIAMFIWIAAILLLAKQYEALNSRQTA